MAGNPEKQNPPARAGLGEASAMVRARPEISTAGISTPSIELLLSRLEKVRKAGAGYTARCPAHEDRTASLSVGAGADGKVLIKCFAGCPIGDVLGAIGMVVADLFPRRLVDASPEARRHLQGLALRSRIQAAASVLDHESGVVLIAASDLHQGRMLTNADHDRLAVACERIRAARVAVGSRQ
jgi:hypothetical protein